MYHCEINYEVSIVLFSEGICARASSQFSQLSHLPKRIQNRHLRRPNEIVCIYVLRFFRLVRRNHKHKDIRRGSVSPQSDWIHVCLSTDKRFFLFSCACQLRCPHVRHKDASTRKRRTKKVPLSYACVSPVHMYFFSCAYACVVRVSQPLAYVCKVCLFAVCCCVVRATNTNRNTEQGIVFTFKKKTRP